MRTGVILAPGMPELRPRATSYGLRSRRRRVDVSPDIVFEATPQLFTLNGSVDIPWARITVQEVPETAVGVSSNEVMLNDQLQPIAPRSASIPISSNLVIRIGNDVRLNAFGLKARLQGDLRMMQDQRGLGLNGQINIPSGSFRAYGQDLIVNKGILLFSGPPDQPLLNIEAIEILTLPLMVLLPEYVLRGWQIPRAWRYSLIRQCLNRRPYLICCVARGLAIRG